MAGNGVGLGSTGIMMRVQKTGTVGITSRGTGKEIRSCDRWSTSFRKAIQERKRHPLENAISCINMKIINSTSDSKCGIPPGRCFFRLNPELDAVLPMANWEAHCSVVYRRSVWSKRRDFRYGLDKLNMAKH